MQIIISLQEEDQDIFEGPQDVYELSLMLRDALGEYIKHRGGSDLLAAEHYVQQRYPEWSEKQQKEKIERVRRACRLALALRAASVQIYAAEDPRRVG